MMVTKVFLDIDGVLSMWNERVRNWFDVDYKDPEDFFAVHKLLGITEEELFKIIDNMHFWRDMPKWPEADEVVFLLESKFGPENICMLTSCPYPNAIIGKELWVKNYFPQFYDDRRIIYAHCKHFCAAKDHLLVDDAEHNVDNWNGPSILYPQNWNRNRQFRDNKIEFLQYQLAYEVTND